MHCLPTYDSEKGAGRDDTHPHPLSGSCWLSHTAASREGARAGLSQGTESRGQGWRVTEDTAGPLTVLVLRHLCGGHRTNSVPPAPAPE